MVALSLSFMLLLFALLLINISLCGGESLPELTPFEKDKYLSCKELVSMLLKHDEKVIDATLTQTNFLLSGIKVVIYVDMTKNCVYNIDDELVRLIYVDSKRVVKMKGIDDGRLSFIKVNYTDYKDMESYSFDEHQAKVLKYINMMNPNQKSAFGNYFTEEAMNKRIEAQIERIKNRKNGTTETLPEERESNGNDNDNDTSFEEEFNVTTIQKAKYVIDLNELFAGLFDGDDNNTTTPTTEANITDDIDSNTNRNQTDKEVYKTKLEADKVNDTEMQSDL